MDPELIATSYTHLFYDTEEEYETAIADLTEELTTHPDNVAALNNRAVALREFGQRNRAVADLDAAILVSGSDPVPLINRAQLRREGGDLIGALSDLDTAIALGAQVGPSRDQIVKERGQVTLSDAD